MLDLFEIERWLKGKKCQYHQLLTQFIIFGSVLRDCHVNDVDIIVISTEWKIRDVLRDIKTGFAIRFGVPLHIQIFHRSQAKEIGEFVERARIVKEVL